MQRDSPASACPEPAWFEQRVAAHAGSAALIGQFQVALSRDGDLWRASIARANAPQSTAHPTHDAERTLTDRSAACEPLAEAVALTIAILAGGATTTQDTLTEPRSAASSAPTAATAAATATASSQHDVDPDTAPTERNNTTNPPPPLALWVGAGVGAAVSFISPVAPQLGASLTLDVAHFRGALRLLFTTQQTFELAPGSVTVQAFLANLLACFATAPARFGIAACAAVDIGALHGKADGFDQQDPSTRPYLAFGLEAQPTLHVSRRFRLSLALAALVPTSQESFSVTGRGVAYEPPPLNFRALLFAEIGVY